MAKKKHTKAAKGDSCQTQDQNTGEPDLLADVRTKSCGKREPTTESLAPSTFNVIIHVLLPDKKIQMSKKKVKTVKQEPLKRGPKILPVTVNWDGFLQAVATAIGIQVDVIDIDTLEWRWTKPANSAKWPIGSPKGLAALIEELESRKKDWSVIVTMKKPKLLAIDNANEDEDDSTEGEDQPASKKAKIDDSLEEIAQQIELKYPLGNCPQHPNILCFHHRPTDLHFELNRPRRLVWANAINAGNASLEKIPLGSPFFQAKQAIKKTTVPPILPPHPEQLPLAGMYPPYFPGQVGSPSLFQFGMGMPYGFCTPTSYPSGSFQASEFTPSAHPSSSTAHHESPSRKPFRRASSQ